MSGCRRYVWGLIVVAGLFLTGGIGAAEPSQPETCLFMPSDEKMRCYRQQLESVLQTEGTEQALATLEQITAQDPEALREAHPLVHHVGQQSFVRYGTAPLALSHCRDVFWSGCYHGVLQAYLSSLPVVEPPACHPHFAVGHIAEVVVSKSQGSFFIASLYKQTTVEQFL